MQICPNLLLILCYFEMFSHHSDFIHIILTMVIYTSSHIMFQMWLSWYLLDDCCYMKIPANACSLPNIHQSPSCMLSACLPVFISFFLTVHLFLNDTKCRNSADYPNSSQLGLIQWPESSVSIQYNLNRNPCNLTTSRI